LFVRSTYPPVDKIRNTTICQETKRKKRHDAEIMRRNKGTKKKKERRKKRKKEKKYRVTKEKTKTMTNKK
jgi:hypothetical protein